MLILHRLCFGYGILYYIILYMVMAGEKKIPFVYTLTNGIALMNVKIA